MKSSLLLAYCGWLSAIVFVDAFSTQCIRSAALSPHPPPRISPLSLWRCFASVKRLITRRPSMKRAANDSDDDDTLSSYSIKRIVEGTNLPTANSHHSASSPNADQNDETIETEDQNTNGPTSTLDFFSKIAKKWAKEEVEYYGRNNPTDYVPLVVAPTHAGIEPPLEHLKKACEEFARRFADTGLEEASKTIFERELCSESPYLLVATNVKDDWKMPEAFTIPSARFILVPDKDDKDSSMLFIKCLAGPVHGETENYIFGPIHGWIWINQLDSFVSLITSAGKAYQPDGAFGPISVPDRCNPTSDVNDNMAGKPFPRLVIEIEYRNRNGAGLRKEGFAAMSNCPYTRMFLAVKTWPKDSEGNFSAAAALWGKNQKGEIEFRKAFDIGTKPMATISRRLFENQPSGSDSMLPPVTKWTRPRPNPKYKTLRQELESIVDDEIGSMEQQNADWLLVLPASDLFYKTSRSSSTKETPYLLNEPRAIPDCSINLQRFTCYANNFLDIEAKNKDESVL